MVQETVWRPLKLKLCSGPAHVMITVGDQSHLLAALNFLNQEAANNDQLRILNKCTTPIEAAPL